MKTKQCDVLIVGTGVAGLYCALNLPASLDIMLITKAAAEECDSFLAQGGICVLKADSDYDSYFEDTMRAGHYENKKSSVDTMIRHSPEIIADLIRYGTRFEKNADGSLRYTKEGAHSSPRILFHADITGKEITSHLLAAVRALPNVTLLENTTMLDIIEASAPDGSSYCAGVVAERENELYALYATETVWACGGIGGLFAHSTKYPHLTGDALGIALKHHIALENPDYIQIHPTTLYVTEPAAALAGIAGAASAASTAPAARAEKSALPRARAFLISESVRGEGGILYNKRLEDGGVRFVNELLPRDVVTNAINEQMQKDGTDCVWLSMEHIAREEIVSHFKHIYEACLAAGYDCTKEPIPVVPAQHYFMGGIYVDKDSRTTMEQLYAVGETSCNGVHGRNRLASNSLLESLVFAKRAAADIAATKDYKKAEDFDNLVNMDGYEDLPSIMENYHAMVVGEIKKEASMRSKEVI